ncbi:hypothetical protein G5C33_08335 [Sphingosinithalassobacter tenebrarum]|uniref:C-type lysozyme inhibitor domain-containing protein n=2 Tax=Stakelama tenebrarum TaxID=2711215 RepID=A0A6G6YAK4_9SPHN|nr:hypothetical protein G5C33_08335 [Sphingosinithalassobacter tenebrarum]
MLKIAPFAAVALLSLSACNHEPEEVDSRAPDPMAAELANAEPVAPPPSIAQSVTFRCQPGNKLVAIDYFTGDTMIAVKLDPEAPVGTTLNAAEAGEPFTGEGMTVSGSKEEVTIEQEDGETLTCKA